MTAIDYAWARPTLAQLQGAGITTVFRYVGPPSWGKTIDQGEYNMLTGAGIAVFLVFEQGANDSAGGFVAGAQNAHVALLYLPTSYPTWAPIFMACDEALSGPALTTAGDYIAGASSLLGAERTGVYGEGALCHVAHVAGTAAYFWQSASTGFPGNATTLPITHIQQGGGGSIQGTDLDVIVRPIAPPAPIPPIRGDGMFGDLAASKQDDFNATVRYLWGQVRTDPLTGTDTNILWYVYNQPAINKGWGGSFDLVLANIIDGAQVGGKLRASWAGAA